MSDMITRLGEGFLEDLPETLQLRDDQADQAEALADQVIESNDTVL